MTRDDRRRELVQALKAEHQQAKEISAERAEEASKASLRERDLGAAVARAENISSVSADTCLRCLLVDGVTSSLKTLPSDTALDRFRCPVCGDEEERRS